MTQIMVKGRASKSFIFDVHSNMEKFDPKLFDPEARNNAYPLA